MRRGNPGTLDPLRLRVHHWLPSVRVSDPGGTLLSACGQGLTGEDALQLLARKFPFSIPPLPPAWPPAAWPSGPQREACLGR